MQQPTTTKREVTASVLDYVDDKYTEVSGVFASKLICRCPELLKMPVIGYEITTKIACFFVFHERICAT